MEFTVEDILHHPRKRVFETYRDRLEAIADYIENAEKIEVREREELDEYQVKMVNFWQGTVDEVPRIARPFVKKDMMTWIDRAHWDSRDFTCRWKFEPSFFTRHVDCHGVNRFLEEGPDKTRISIEVVLNIDLLGVKGVPRFLARKAGPTVEKFLHGRVRPNLIQVNRGVERFLDAS